MKQWKTTLATVVIALLVAGLGLMAYNNLNKVPSPDAKAVSDLQVRIGQLKILVEEQTLTRDIMLLQLEIKELNLKAQAPPVIKDEFVPTDKLPEKMKKYVE